MLELNKGAIVETSVCPVESDEVAKHTSENDCWCIFDGKVYDITRYLDMHPGGRRHLLEYAGMDLTDEFLRVHPWVNAQFLLKSLCVGRLKLEQESNEMEPTKVDTMGRQ
uniref:Putative cytochrome b5-like heme/steroid binding domain protein n=1 Tax=Amblyomma aureolatum TaxID=187763 RepID=A0A1E1X106_9ACAR